MESPTMAGPNLAEMNRKAELEMYRRLTVEEGALLMAWLQSTAHPWRITQSFSDNYEKLERQAHRPTGKSAE